MLFDLFFHVDAVPIVGVAQLRVGQPVRLQMQMHLSDGNPTVQFQGMNWFFRAQRWDVSIDRSLRKQLQTNITPKDATAKDALPVATSVHDVQLTPQQAADAARKALEEMVVPSGKELLIKEEEEHDKTLHENAPRGPVDIVVRCEAICVHVLVAPCDLPNHSLFNMFLLSLAEIDGMGCTQSMSTFMLQVHTVCFRP